MAWLVVTALGGELMLFVVRDTTADSPPASATATAEPRVTPTASTPAIGCSSPSPAAGILCPPTAVPYSHSWYVTDSADMAALGSADAQWLSQQTANSTCSGDYLTVLDFGHPTRKYSRAGASPLDDYAMTLFGYRESWRTFHEIEQLAERYLDAWVSAASACPRLHLVLGTSNFAECQQAVGMCTLSTAGQYWDIVVHDLMDYVAAKGYSEQVTDVWVGDDLETSWDPWPTTERFLDGVAAQEGTYATHARMVDYGDANVGVCSVVTRSCRAPWTAANVYAAAWGMGWAVPLPEIYSSDTAQRWASIAQTYPTMAFIGVMTECGGADPLPVAGCQRGQSGDLSAASGAGPSTGAGTCEWSPAMAFNTVQSNDPRHPLAYATNIQWPPGQTSGQPPADYPSCG